MVRVLKPFSAVIATVLSLGLAAADTATVSVLGDATYTIPSSRGAVCKGEGAYSSGTACPLKGDVASDNCSEGLPSYTYGQCVAPKDAQCVIVSGTTWGCAYPEDEGSVDTDAPCASAEQSASGEVETPYQSAPSGSGYGDVEVTYPVEETYPKEDEVTFPYESNYPASTPCATKGNEHAYDTPSPTLSYPDDNEEGYPTEATPYSTQTPSYNAGEGAYPTEATPCPTHNEEGGYPTETPSYPTEATPETTPTKEDYPKGDYPTGEYHHGDSYDTVNTPCPTSKDGHHDSNPNAYEHTEKPSYEHTDKPTYEHTEKPTYEHTEKPSYEHTDKPTYEHTDKPTYEHTEKPSYDKPNYEDTGASGSVDAPCLSGTSSNDYEVHSEVDDDSKDKYPSKYLRGSSYGNSEDASGDCQKTGSEGYSSVDGEESKAGSEYATPDPYEGNYSSAGSEVEGSYDEYQSYSSSVEEGGRPPAPGVHILPPGPSAPEGGEHRSRGTHPPPEDNTAPEEETTAPKEETPAPAYTSAPEDTNAPEEETTAPEEETTAPAYTTAPEEETTAPVDTLPKEDTTAPVYTSAPTPAPAYTSDPAEDEAQILVAQDDAATYPPMDVVF
ncbi:uncharacterized protein PITG_06318 [Phytophthora infestans T30-4]|uniref:Cyst germination specific acidic repeat protein n=1 Tax=Phytophthora infestans (strain T30-4) TaxID=403677 RepID=D0N4K4_PHYIT|nr:uncharacterized protein PITG_06318 [Phytophthora infestans T30-4]EEY69812.1 conserved hypothetical protein [Phytophthora infestans T30-4]|eukprot:XP_002998459.1 conserved hypothetical protein [Phytophthora infestans T30-4]